MSKGTVAGLLVLGVVALGVGVLVSGGGPSQLGAAPAYAYGETVTTQYGQGKIVSMGYAQGVWRYGVSGYGVFDESALVPAIAHSLGLGLPIPQ